MKALLSIVFLLLALSAQADPPRSDSLAQEIRLQGEQSLQILTQKLARPLGVAPPVAIVKTGAPRLVAIETSTKIW